MPQCLYKTELAQRKLGTKSKEHKTIILNVAQVANFPYSCDLFGNLIKQSNISTFERVRQCSDYKSYFHQVVSLNNKKSREWPEYQWFNG